MKTFVLSVVSIFIISFSGCSQDTKRVKEEIDAMLVSWHKAASEADFIKYFGMMTDDSVFLGTDATENWQSDEFKAFSKPYFDKGKAWSFTTLERNIYLETTYENIAWFDEHLSTQMGICRGSGVVVLENGTWKIKHYVLSIAIPNENVTVVTELKKEWDNRQIEKY